MMKLLLVSAASIAAAPLQAQTMPEQTQMAPPMTQPTPVQAPMPPAMPQPVAGMTPPAAAMTWMDAPPALPAGAKMAVVSGDPGKAGDFKVQIQMPAGYAVPAHHHPTEERVQVLSGTLNYGMSDKLDRAKAKPLTAGKHVVMAAQMNHWVFADAPATIEVSGKGPFQIVYVDPKDDPRGSK
jgi:quercetin dioxygenase-like cupin family protein